MSFFVIYTISVAGICSNSKSKTCSSRELISSTKNCYFAYPRSCTLNLRCELYGIHCMATEVKFIKKYKSLSESIIQIS